MIDAKSQTNWEQDCRRYRGAVLTGHFSHWCQDWDGLPVDETCLEWPCPCSGKMVEDHNEAVVDGHEACVAVGMVTP